MNLFIIHCWHTMASIRLTIVLCVLLTLNAAWGYFCLHGNASLFMPMNDMGLIPWAMTYGRSSLLLTAWFFLLLVLLTLLVCNTFTCTTDRVFRLLRAGKTSTPMRLIFKLAPHLMHYALIIILAGYLCSYLFSQVLTGQTLVPGTHLSLPGTKGQVTFTSFAPEYYQGQRLDFFTDHILTPRANLLLSSEDSTREAILTATRPVRFQGYTLHMINFAPKSLGGMNMHTRIDLHIRKDSGVLLYLTGMALFSFGLLFYVCEWIFFKEVNKQSV